jgi:G3E family GTPase
VRTVPRKGYVFFAAVQQVQGRDVTARSIPRDGPFLAILSFTDLSQNEQAALIPATILTGFLGAGKSTLLRRVLTEQHGRKIAVIENEFGEENIDTEIIVSGGEEQIVTLSNGCLCCGIREDLSSTLADLAKRRHAGEISFDQVMIETTGLADPGSIAQTFFLEAGITAEYRPDAVLTVVDAKHAMDQLDARSEPRRQVGFADRLFISKVDLVDDDRLASLSARLKRLNPHARQSTVAFGAVELTDVFDVRGFNLTADLEFEPQIVCGSGAAHNHDDHAHHHHDDDVKSFRVPFRKAVSPGKVWTVYECRCEESRPGTASLQRRTPHGRHGSRSNIPGRPSADEP